jgi:uncharacterized protein
MKFGFKILLLSLAVIVLPIAAFAYRNPGVPSGFVNDYAGVLSAEQKAQLEGKLQAFEKQTSNEISIVTIKSLDGDTIENFAAELFKDWSIGKKGKDNGVLILVAVDDRKMRIEVGYGLEGYLTDAQSSWIINKQMRPAFKANNFFGGLNEAADKIIGATQGEGVPSDSKTTEPSDDSGFPFEAIFYIGIFMIQFLAAILGRSKSWWAGGVIGGLSGLVVGLIKGLAWGVGSVVLLIPLGLLFDFAVSNAYEKGKSSGHMPWWIGGSGGRGSSGGSSFGGFGGGMSGGGGSSGSW